MVHSRGGNVEEKILVVDDEEPVRISLTRILEYGGYEVITARNGMEALAEMERGACDLVLTDECMPQISGIQLIGMIKPKYPSVPIVLVTGQGFAAP